jgi:hypothetical protein
MWIFFNKCIDFRMIFKTKKNITYWFYKIIIIVYTNLKTKLLYWNTPSQSNAYDLHLILLIKIVINFYY